MNKAYYERMAAVEYAVTHDDGMNIDNLDGAEILIVGVSRTSKTPTSMYLANRGFRVANYALVPNVDFPIENVKLQSNLFVIGLISEVQHLVNIRRNRLDYLRDKSNASYINEEYVTNELNSSKKLFLNNGWPVINVSRKSIEETAATIIFMYNQWKSK